MSAHLVLWRSAADDGKPDVKRYGHAFPWVGGPDEALALSSRAAGSFAEATDMTAKASASQLLTGASPSTSIPRDGTFLGGLFESLAALSVRTLAQSCDARVSHLRTKGGRHEVDFIVAADNGVVAIEVTLSAAVNDTHVSHLQWLRDELGDECVDVVILNTGPEAYRRPDGVAVVPLALLLP